MDGVRAEFPVLSVRYMHSDGVVARVPVYVRAFARIPEADLWRICG